jgi:hypothetical protein
MLKIVVTEYPKSGGSWVTGMLGDALGLSKRDIYVDDDYKVFDVRKHPWYEGAPSLGLTESCVIKSHERPNSPLITFPAQFIHLVRDGRDVAVSRYFYEKEFCVENGIYERFDEPFDEYVRRVAAEWREYILAWLDVAPHTYRYEDFLQDPFGTLQRVLDGLGITVPDSQINYAVEANTKDKFKRALEKTFRHNTFVRRGTGGDWRNHFDDEHIQAFKQIAGDALVRLGYERDLNWCR